MSWIKTISFEEATGKLKTIYNRIKGPNNQIDNVLSIHSLRPHTLTGHMSLYKNVLHHSDNTFDNWFLELLGTYTSFLNKCDYCFEHHFVGMSHFLDNNQKAKAIKQAIQEDNLSSVLNNKQLHLANYTKKLTFEPYNIQKSDIEMYQQAGIDDGELLEINQVVSYFNYVNRTVLGLGVNTNNEVLGLSPKNTNSETEWSHQ
ncbi:peroxidase-related enzyme [Pseudofulvibacter geojedonensis]|uniref:Peroxidase-related enzyme n=1 Tax=Pseudofulvibacter geojedonensis TaxID=1123758 RepID=A0ABW3HYE1_9FLAO